MTIPMEAFVAGLVSCSITWIVCYRGRRRRLRRLLREASVHADPDRRVSALFVAALDGLRRHLDLVVDRALNETAEVVLSSLVDLVMDARWKDDRDGLVRAVRAWAEEWVAEQRTPSGGGRCQRAGAIGRACGVIDTIDALELVDSGDCVAPRATVGLPGGGAAIRAWVRCGGAPQIDALEVVEAVAGMNRRARKRSRTPGTNSSGPHGCTDVDPILDDLIAEGLASMRLLRSTATPPRPTARGGSRPVAASAGGAR
jgi:hypothetical protein